MTDTALKWGFLATGAIAATVATDLAGTGAVHRFAVASRDVGRARAFADRHGFERSYGSYDELLADPDVDAVYVATPHGQHHAVTSRVLAAGKPVLVEKAFTCSLAAGQDLARQARAGGVFAMEGMWARFQPAMVALRQLVADGAIGDVRAVHADLGLVAPFDPSHRLFDPALGGGALLDVGVYVVSFAQMLLGSPSSVAATGQVARTGVDLEAGLLLGYDSGAHAVLSCSLGAESPGRGAVIGTKGRILVEPRFHHTPRIRLERPGQEPVVIENALQGRGFGPQFEHVADCLAQGLTESPVMPLDDTLSVLTTLDAALEQLGVPHLDEGFEARR